LAPVGFVPRGLGHPARKFLGNMRAAVPLFETPKQNSNLREFLLQSRPHFPGRRQSQTFPRTVAVPLIRSKANGVGAAVPNADPCGGPGCRFADGGTLNVFCFPLHSGSAGSPVPPLVVRRRRGGGTNRRTTRRPVASPLSASSATALPAPPMQKKAMAVIPQGLGITRFSGPYERFISQTPRAALRRYSHAQTDPNELFRRDETLPGQTFGFGRTELGDVVFFPFRIGLHCSCVFRHKRAPFILVRINRESDASQLP